MDQKYKSEACEILRKEFKKSEKYCNWRSEDDRKNVNQASLLSKKFVDGRKLVLLIKQRSEDTDSHSSVSRQQSTDSENSVTSSQYSPLLSSGFEKKEKTYWSIQRGKF